MADSWIAGGINTNEPPYVFIFSSLKRTAPDLLQFRDAVLGISQESIDENGGLLETTDEQSNARELRVASCLMARSLAATL